MRTAEEFPTDEVQLEERLARPTDGVVAALEELPGDVVVLGAAGKMGPSLATMARRALDRIGRRDRVIAVARFSNREVMDALESARVDTMRCDLLDADAVALLPDAPNVIFMAGQKFGTSSAPSLTWAMNTLVPSLAAERYARSRIVAFSTGNVYPLSPVNGPAPRETHAVAPVGDYAMSCLGRERIFEHHSARHHTPVALLRLNYAVDLRYGVLVDIAGKVWRDEPVDVAMGYANVIWQGDANSRALQSLTHASSPPLVLNLTGQEVVSVREMAERFSRRFGRTVRLTGHEAPDALLSDPARSYELFGPPSVSLDTLVDWVAAWVERGGRLLGKPTRFESRDGSF